MPKLKKKCWSEGVGVHGSRVRVAELKPGGPLSLLWIAKGRRQNKVSLGHKDRKRGKEQALQLAARLSANRQAFESEALTIARLFEIYESKGLQGRSTAYAKEMKRQLLNWYRFLGPNRTVTSLSPSDVKGFVEARKKASAVGGRKPKKATTFWHDLAALKVALNFALTERDSFGRPLLQHNPLEKVRLPKTVSPSRPVANDDFYPRLKEVSLEVGWKFDLMLDLANITGHRIGAILQLQWKDVSFAPEPTAPFGSIHWRSETDKINNDHTVAMSRLCHTALIRAKTRFGDDKGGLVLPSESDPTQPVERRLANKWLRKACRLAGVGREEGQGWHSFRRAFVTRRKPFPLKDVAAAGGWKDTRTMMQCYMQPDAQGVLNVVCALDNSDQTPNHTTSHTSFL